MININTILFIWSNTNFGYVYSRRGFDRKTGNRILQRRWQYFYDTFRSGYRYQPRMNFFYASDISRYTRPSSMLYGYSTFAGCNRTMYHQSCERRYWSPLAWKFRIDMGDSHSPRSISYRALPRHEQTIVPSSCLIYYRCISIVSRVSRSTIK